MAEQDMPADAAADSRVRGADDVLTIAAIAVVAYVLADVFHEGVGHGGACLLVGGHLRVLSTVHLDCSVGGRVVAAGGTAVNLVLGALFLLWARVARTPRYCFFLWLAMTVNLLVAGGYFLFSGVGNIGDWADVIAGLRPVWLWRVSLALVGVMLYTAFIAIALRELRPFLDASTPQRVRRARRLCLVSYVTGGLVSCIAGLLNPVGMILVAISAAAASLGGTSGLAWMWQLVGHPRLVRPHDTAMPPIDRSVGWMATGALLALVFIFVVGPGITFRAT